MLIDDFCWFIGETVLSGGSWDTRGTESDCQFTGLLTIYTGHYLLRFKCLSWHIGPKKGSVQFSPSDFVSLMSFVREGHIMNTKRPRTLRAEAGDMLGG